MTLVAELGELERFCSFAHPRELQKRQEQQPSAVRAIAWPAQLRLNHRYRQLPARGLQHNKICVAIARELAGFLWSIGQQVSVCA